MKQQLKKRLGQLKRQREPTQKTEYPADDERDEAHSKRSKLETGKWGFTFFDSKEPTPPTDGLPSSFLVRKSDISSSESDISSTESDISSSSTESDAHESDDDDLLPDKIELDVMQAEKHYLGMLLTMGDMTGSEDTRDRFILIHKHIKLCKKSLDIAEFSISGLRDCYLKSIYPSISGDAGTDLLDVLRLTSRMSLLTFALRQDIDAFISKHNNSASIFTQSLQNVSTLFLKVKKHLDANKVYKGNPRLFTE